MVKKAILVAVVWAEASSGAWAQSEKLAFLIPHLYGVTGLKVDSQANLPDGSTHSAHFNSAFQAEFTQFNIALASQLASVPLPSPASGFTYELDPSLGVMKRSTQSFGPILTERSETIGKKKFSLGLNYQNFTYDTLEGQSLDSISAVFTHDNPAPGGRADVVATTNSIDVTLNQFTAFFTYGLLDRMDISLGIPVVNVDLGVVSDANIVRIGTAATPATHFFADPSVPGGYGTTKQFNRTGSASGLGDMIFRIKGTILKGGSTGLALAADVRFPTGDEEDLLGSGAWGFTPFLAFSTASKRISPHINLGYQFNGKTVLAGNVLTGQQDNLPNQFTWAGGFDIGLGKRVTMVLDVLGRTVFDSPRLQTQTFTTLDGSRTFPDIHFQNETFNIVNGSGGFKINAGGKLLVDLNVLFKLNNSGLRDTITPLFGVEYTF